MRKIPFLALLLCACPPGGIQKIQDKRGGPVKQVKRLGLADFERARSQTSFIPQASVIWSPELPTRSDRLTVFYNSASHFSRCAGDQLTLTVVPLAGGPPVKKSMQKGRDGIFYHVFQPSELPRPGFMYFATARGQQCDNNHGSPWKLPVVDKLPDYRVVRSTFFDFYYLAQDRPTSRRAGQITAGLDSGFERILAATGLRPERRIAYYFYPTRDLLRLYQANNGNNFEEYRSRVYEWENPTSLHEVTHLLFQQIGRHVGLLDEGVAIHYGQELVDKGWRGRPCDSWTRELLRQRRLPQIGSLLTPMAFYKTGSDTLLSIHYPTACSFVGFLIRTRGLQSFKKLFAAVNDDNRHSVAKVEALFAKTYDEPLVDLEKRWRASLIGQNPSVS